ncbi:MAG: DNA primase, partial [Deferrisomatales bacterium]|nr:DNA primase [Deferrisomatales bacterium]
MRIPDEVLEEIRGRVSVVDVVGRHVALKRSGKNWKGLCPFHAEKTPSFVVNEERGSYHCFGCGAGGSVFRFLMEVEGRSFNEAVQELADKAGVALRAGPEDAGVQLRRERREQLLDVLTLAARYYRHQLTDGRAGAEARHYLTGREVPTEAVELFGLGCAPAGWDHLARYLARKGVDPDLSTEAGLISPRRSGGHYDRLRDRLVFPIHDATGRVVSFGGRILGEGEPKYLNGPESPVFHKGAVLYGLHQGTEALRRERRALLVEGYLDVISLHARGIATAVAPLGTAVTPEHVQLLRRRVDEAVLVF